MPGTPDSREYDRLVGRKFRPYSEGHRFMYEKPIAAFRNMNQRPRIFEAGFGIGWGLDRMVDSGIFEEYVGCEPNGDSFRYTQSRHGTTPNVVLHNEQFTPEFAASLVAQGVAPFDAAFCIEVIEHVPMDEHVAFLTRLRDMAPLLYFSTPDSRKSKEGARTMEAWQAMLREVGFSRVFVDTSKWTYLYECEL